jgi:hypothetical protein
MKSSILFAAMGTFLFLIILVACHNDPLEPEYGTVQLKFDNIVGTQDLKLDGATYTNGSGESFSVSKLNYFISNIKLKKADGSAYVIPQDSSYFLVSESSVASQSISLRNIPVDDYTGIDFVVGVDSLRNTMEIGKRTGALDPGGIASGMYWDWNSGYIFLKLEGTSPKAPIDATGKGNFMYHVGLFGGYKTPTINNLRTIQLTFGAEPGHVVVNGTTSVTIKADVLKIFDGVKPISIAKTPDIMISDSSKNVANNYARMFSFDKVQLD